MCILAEGSPQLSESKEPIFTPIVHSESSIKIPSALEGTVFQPGVTLEDRDDNDLQDASLTTDECKPARHPHTIPSDH
jgi:hypothetical protein